MEENHMRSRKTSDAFREKEQSLNYPNWQKLIAARPVGELVIIIFLSLLSAWCAAVRERAHAGGFNYTFPRRADSISFDIKRRASARPRRRKTPLLILALALMSSIIREQPDE
jgi:peptidoglycan/LPS O-acetylase OafA/YrhL